MERTAAKAARMVAKVVGELVISVSPRPVEPFPASDDPNYQTVDVCQQKRDIDARQQKERVVSEKTKGKSHEIREAVRKNPAITVGEIAAEMSCSRQYVHSVLSRAGLRAARPAYLWETRRSPTPPPLPRLQLQDGSPPLTHTIVGAISELMVATDLLARGWSVFFPLFRARSDLIATSPNGTTVKRFEVRSAKRRDGKLVYPTKPTDECDHYALVVVGEQVTYKPPLCGASE